jgi:hypothetical protein
MIAMVKNAKVVPSVIRIPDAAGQAEREKGKSQGRNNQFFHAADMENSPRRFNVRA